MSKSASFNYFTRQKFFYLNSHLLLILTLVESYRDETLNHFKIIWIHNFQISRTCGIFRTDLLGFLTTATPTSSYILRRSCKSLSITYLLSHGGCLTELINLRIYEIFSMVISQEAKK